MSGGPAVTGELLQRLERGLVEAGVPVVEHLQPGLEVGEINRLLGPLRLTADDLHPDLRAWWSWHDGSLRVLANGLRQPQPIISSWMHLPLREAVEATLLKREVCSPYEMYSVEPRPWTEHVEPLMWTEPLLSVVSDNGGQIAAVDTARDDSALFYARIDDELFAPPLARSMGALIEHWCSLLEEPAGSPVGYPVWPGGPKPSAPSFPDEPPQWTA